MAVQATRAISGLLALVVLAVSGVANSFYTALDSGSGTLPSVEAGPGNVDAPGVQGENSNILLVGSDSRAGYTKEQLDLLSTTDDGGGLNTDSIMLIHIPADGKSASAVSFPRDSYVSIPGYGMGKINSAYALGYQDAEGTEAARRGAGQALLIATISQLTGVQVDGYVEVTLLGLVELTNELGGIEVNLCQAAKDQNSGTDLPAGISTLDGKQALGFVRQRYGLDEFGGDLARVKRQQYFFGAVLRKALSTNLFDLAKVSNLISTLSGTLRYSAGLDPIGLAEQMQGVVTGQVKLTTIPLAEVEIGTVDGQSVVFTQSPEQIKQFMMDLNSAPAKPSSSTSSQTSTSTPSDTPEDSGTPGPTSTAPAPEVTTAANTGCIN